MIIANDPWYFLWVIGNTFWVKQEFLFKSTIGLLGWLDMPLAPIVYIGYMMALGAILYKSLTVEKKSFSLMPLLFLTAIIGGTTISLLYHFYLNSTPVAWMMVDSLQGRYILPVLPFIIYCAIQWLRIFWKNKVPMIAFGGLIFLFCISCSFFDRYYDYSRIFDNPDELRAQEKSLIEGGSVANVTVLGPESWKYNMKFPDYKIGGFQILVAADSNKPVTVPYRFELKDSTCTNVIRRGYLDQTELHRPHIYTQILPITPVRYDSICLTLTPLGKGEQMQYLALVADQSNKPVVHFLYIKR
jgi:hypothetical protein